MGRGNGEVLLNGYRVSILQDEKNLESVAQYDIANTTEL